MGNSCFNDADAKKNTPSPAVPPTYQEIYDWIMSLFSSQPDAEWGEDEILSLMSSNYAIGPPNHNLIRVVLGEGVVNGVLALQSGLYSVNSKPSSQGSPADALDGGSPCWGGNGSDMPSECRGESDGPGTLSELDIRRLFLKDEKEWPTSSANYFLRDYHRTGDGKRGLVYNSLIDTKRNTDFSALNDLEMQYHLHITNIHHGMHQSKSKDVCEMTSYIVSQSLDQKKRAMEAMHDGFEESIKKTLMKNFPPNQIGSMMDEIKKDVAKKMEEFHSQIDDEQKINHPTKYNRVRSCYVDGPNSIIQNLPMPTVDIQHDCAHISANHIVNHLLAHGVAVLFLRVGFPEDWVDADGEYPSQFMKDLHEEVKNMMNADPNLSKWARVIVIRIWSDGFEAHQIKGHNNFNSLQLFTLTLRAPKGKRTRRNTLPYALCFKKQNHHDIFLRLLKEVRDMFAVSLRYWGEDKQFHQTIVALDFISGDLPERCGNSCISFKGKFTHRWGHSCIYDDSSTPSCPSCELARIESILDDTDNVRIEPCGTCSDWWSPSRVGVHIGLNKHPVDPSAFQDIGNDFPSVELSFELLKNSIAALPSWYRQSTRNGTTPKKAMSIAKDYLQMLGLSAQLVPGLVTDICHGVDIYSSHWYPKILVHYLDLGIELKKLPPLPMHMLFLGVEKSLISKTKILVNRRKSSQNMLWRELTNAIHESQKTINTISIDWCLSMSFSGKDPQQLGTANWQSDHYLAFTRLSLFHFGALERKIAVPPERAEVLCAFKRLRVVWFCLIANIFSGESVSTSRIDNYVKIFLSSCRALWLLAKDQLSGKEVDDDPEDGSSNTESSKKRKTPSSGVEKNQTTKKTKTQTKPFFTSGSNYLSMLGIARMIELFGDMRESWEGHSESYIQNLKKEIPTMRHTTQFLTTILRKLLRTGVFSIVNEDNPFSFIGQADRTQNLKIYRKSNHPNPISILEENDVVVGVVDSNSNLCLCVGQSGTKEITLHPLAFDDAQGHWCYNLWFSQTNLDPPLKTYKTRGDLMANISDIFLLLRPISLDPTESMEIRNHRTLICRSWKVRDNSGDLRLPVPHKDILLMDT